MSSQSDSECALIAKERQELVDRPEEELSKLAGLYEAQGLSPQTARQVAVELTAHDALGAHLSAELNIDPDDVVSLWHAALASAVSFLVGAVIPLIVILVAPAAWRIPTTFVVVLGALAVTGAIGAGLGGSAKPRAAARVVVGGAIALGVTYAIGSLLGASGVV